MQPNARIANACLNWDAFVNFNLGNLSELELEAISAHVSTCPQCESNLIDWQSTPIADKLADKIRQCISLPEFADEPACRDMETAALAIVGGGARAVDLRSPFRSMADAIGKSVGPYLILEQIGCGGMGIVFRARQHTVRRDVALKMIRAGVYADPAVIARFHQEARAAGRLQHPGVVRLYDFAEYDGLPYVVMEFVDGGSLADKLRKGPFSFREAAELLQRVAEAIGFAHQNHVIHRDLKPSNILLAADGSPKITDFGLAKLLDDRGDLTQTDAVLGTPSYMSPEQAAGGRAAIGVSTDIYSMGAILYELIGGRPPFIADNKLETIRMVCEKPAVPPSSLRQGVPRDLEAICLKCLEKSPAQRYPTARALADDLGRWLRSERPRDIPGRSKRAARALGRRWVLIAWVVAAGIIAGSFGVAAYIHDPERPLRQIQGELLAGHPVTLVENAGLPKWKRWQLGEASSQTALASDGALTIHSTNGGLLDLALSPECDEYQISAQIRHEKSNLGKGAGIYFGRRSYPWTNGNIQCFVEITFNDIHSTTPGPIVFNSKKLPNPNYAVSTYYLCANDGTPNTIDQPMQLAAGPDFAPVGEGNTAWRDLVISVSAKNVKFDWDGHAFEIDRATLDSDFEQATAIFKKRFQDNPFAHAIEPSFVARGAMGLCVHQGSASFRNVSVKPLGLASR